MYEMSVTEAGSVVGTEVKFVAPANAPEKLVVANDPHEFTAVK
jgi:hypothetical protein